ncbi:MAG TPA: hypothetical protein DER01_19050 [Phycisphaerales bacterium]|nr:hypothetical protein [Phycisphaerales bacterium]|tara:strand:+ start:60496 stop:63636 length:3141 start_codon:yes stop_codon:yes gene_type:complete
MRHVVLILCLLSQTALAQQNIQVHTASLPKGVQLPVDSQQYLFLEGENESDKVAGDVFAKPEHQDRTIFRTTQIPNDKWWGAWVGYDKSRFAMRGADKSLPWHQLTWDIAADLLTSAVYDAYARVYVTGGGACDLAVTTGEEKPQHITANDKVNINWVPIGSVEINDQTKQVTLHMRTTNSAVRVDTLLLIKVQPKQAAVNLKRIQVTEPAWSKDKGLVFTTDSATLAYQSNAPQRITRFNVAKRLKPDMPLQWETITAESDGTWQLHLDSPGWYDLQIQALLDDGKQLNHDVRVAVLGAPIPEKNREDSVFGMWRVHGDPQLIKLASGRWDRAMTSFRNVTQQQAQSTVATSESAHPYLAKDGLAHTGVFAFGMPLWTMQLPADFKPHGFGNPFYPAKDWDDVSRSVAAYARSRALPLIMEMYNEPLAHWKGTHAQLVEYARAVRKGLKSVDPNFQLGGPCLYSIRIGDLNNLAKAGLFDQLDCIVMHAYVDGTPPEDAFFERIVQLNDLLKQYGQQEKKVYLTEFGWTASEGTWQPHVDRWTQARYAARSLALGWSQGIDGMAYFVLQYKTKNTGEAAFSLIDEQGRPQPGYVAFSGVSRWFAASTPIGHYQLTPTVHMVMGHRDGKLQMALWDTAGVSKIQLPFQITDAADMFGKPLDVSTVFTVSEDPIYLQADQEGLTSLPTRQVVTTMDMRDVNQELFYPMASMGTQTGTLKPGKYAGFVKIDGHWQVQPVELVLPLHLSSLQITWPVDSETPKLMATLRSNQSDQTQQVTLWLDQTPQKKTQLDIPANGIRQVIFAMPNSRLAEQQQSVIHMQLPNGKVTEHSITWTPMQATRNDGSTQGTWADFTAWAPFGKAGDNAPDNDCQAKTRMTYSEQGLRVQVQVTDDEHHQPYVKTEPQKTWAADSIQLAIDVDTLKPWQAGVVGSGLAGHRVYEWTIAGDGSTANAFCNRSYDQSISANTLRPLIQTQVTREQHSTVYDVLIPWSEMGVDTALQAGDVIGFALVVNDVDPLRKAGRHGLRLFRGVAQTKDAKQFGKVWLQ